MKIRITSMIICFLSSITAPLFAQDSPLDTLTSHVAGIRQELDVLKRLNITVMLIIMMARVGRLFFC